MVAKHTEHAEHGTPAGTADGTRLPEVVLISGMSGAGRGTAARVMEELGWYVVDNLAPSLIPRMVTLCADPEVAIRRLAVVSDVRSRSFEWDLGAVIKELRAMGADPTLVFLECADEVLIRRYDQHRLAHPLQAEGTISEGVVTERQALVSLKNRADMVVDTTSLSVHQLRRRLEEAFASGSAGVLNVTVESFGFKYGVPLDADMVMDMRFLPNPYWVPELRELDGRSAPVADYVFAQHGVDEFLDNYEAVLGLMAAGYKREGKRYVLIGIGCTGGKHRSVAVTERLAERIRHRPDVNVSVVHRDLGRE